MFEGRMGKSRFMRSAYMRLPSFTQHLHLLSSQRDYEERGSYVVSSIQVCKMCQPPMRSASGTQSLVLRLQPMHRLVLACLDHPLKKYTKSFLETAKCELEVAKCG